MAFPNGPFIRPHPIIWRIVFGISVLYALILQIVLFQNYADVKKVLSWFDPGLAHEKLSEKVTTFIIFSVIPSLIYSLEFCPDDINLNRTIVTTQL